MKMKQILETIKSLHGQVKPSNSRHVATNDNNKQT
jgi:hypothetical protein